MQLKPFGQLKIFDVCQPSLNLDYVWHISWFLADRT